jgi:hypothetical protein
VGPRFDGHGANEGPHSRFQASRGATVAPLAAPARLSVLRDGRPVATREGTALEHEVEEPGVYRVKAKHWSKGHERTWILSNPIYLR